MKSVRIIAFDGRNRLIFDKYLVVRIMALNGRNLLIFATRCVVSQTLCVIIALSPPSTPPHPLRESGC